MIVLQAIGHTSHVLIFFGKKEYERVGLKDAERGHLLVHGFLFHILLQRDSMCITFRQKIIFNISVDDLLL